MAPVSADGAPRTRRRRHNLHSRARHPAGSLNPASMRSPDGLPSPPAPRDLTEASRFTKCGIGDSWEVGLGEPTDADEDDRYRLGDSRRGLSGGALAPG